MAPQSQVPAQAAPLEALYCAFSTAGAEKCLSEIFKERLTTQQGHPILLLLYQQHSDTHPYNKGMKLPVFWKVESFQKETFDY